MYQIKPAGRHDPRGPDGKGWNRVAIHALEPTARCAMRPRSRQAALDALRGMAGPELATYYGECNGPSLGCRTCKRATKVRDPWNPEWVLREDSTGNVWLLGNAAVGFAGKGHCFADWQALMDDIAVPHLRRQSDCTGFYWSVAAAQ